ncbi:hypothetical protein HAX54_019632 [Datura stramonium]|uniref:Uncharacterized protein n=1 Tax=Datura stramonium TaxID=4076 RepID=A0ABS8URR1_DATST|nr:hypothetical protein [Datura stramonium]
MLPARGSRGAPWSPEGLKCRGRGIEDAKSGSGDKMMTMIKPSSNEPHHRGMCLSGWHEPRNIKCRHGRESSMSTTWPP